MRQRRIELGKLRYPSRPGKIRIFDDILRYLCNGRLRTIHNPEIDKHDGFIPRGQLPTPEPPRVIREPATSRHNKHNMKVWVICTSTSIASNLKHTQPTRQAKALKVAAHDEAMPGIGHIGQTRSEKINRNIANGERQKNKSTSGILRFDPLKTIIILAEQLYRPPPLASRAKSISAKVCGSNQAIISKPNRCTAVPDFRRYIGSNAPNFAGEAKTGILFGLTSHKRGRIVQHNSNLSRTATGRRPIFFWRANQKTCLDNKTTQRAG